MDKDYLILKRASASRLSGEWSEDDYDVLADGIVVGRILKAAAAPVGTPWLWTLAFGHHEDRTPIYGYAETREAAMAAFAKSWAAATSAVEVIPAIITARSAARATRPRRWWVTGGRDISGLTRADLAGLPILQHVRGHWRRRPRRRQSSSVVAFPSVA